MSRIMKGFVITIMSLLSSIVFAEGPQSRPQHLHTPVGYWQTVDDVTGKPKSIVQIWKDAHEVLMGKVVKIYNKEGTQNKICTACQGPKQNQPIVGMVILSGLKVGDAQWKNGRILDPENGKTYKCNVQVAENGKKLNVHGYIGIPLLGRSQTWQRVDLMSIK